MMRTASVNCCCSVSKSTRFRPLWQPQQGSLLRALLTTSMLRIERPIAKIRTLSSSSTSQLPQLEDTIQKVLIANRGEIACRIIRTCRSLGIPTVAIYSSADGPHCLHATMADEAYLIGSGPSSTESYLRSEEIIDVAQRTNANAIHPGFGFLSERASFAQQIQDHQLLFVGPPIHAMEDMASKSRAKRRMDESGVPTTPGFDPYTSSSNNAETVPDETTTIINNITNELLYDQAVHHVGFPLLIKALMGGGGKGMRLVHAAHDFRDALQSCQNEARQSFGDARVLLERYLIHPRHIEVQIIGDQYNNIVHLYERDCSVQRRHQKVLEEAPASNLSEEFRNYIGQLGVKAASAVNYFNAGTVEFLLDTQPQQETQSRQGSDQPYPNIYFCEMNTRLQVEHSVTEQITGIDLVEWQLRVAAGEMLPIPLQEHIPKVNGHSIEARIYAETPTKQFLPSPGRIWYHSPPTKPNLGTDPMTGVRVDTGIQSGQDVSVFYDPMIAKLICHGTNRNDAIERLQTALQNYHIAGVSNNIDFLLRCIQHPTFRCIKNDTIDTGFIEQYGDSIIQDCIDHESARKSKHPMARISGAMAILLQMEQRIQSKDGNAVSTTKTNKGPWSSHSGSWRMGGDTARVQRKLYLMPEKHVITCTGNRDGSFDMNWCSDDGNGDDTFFHVDGTLCANGDMELMVNRTQRLKMTTVMKEENGNIQVRMWPTIGKSHFNEYYWEIDVLDPLSSINADGMKSETTTPMGNGIVVTPIPGKVSRINFKVGDLVRVGDVVVVLEAMKMEHPCTSTCDGTITEIRVTPNTIVPDSAVLFVVTSESKK